MADQYYPLNSTIVRALSDKVYDKRKTAATQVETTVRELDAKGDVNQINKIILVITNLIQPSSPQFSKGGFIGLTAIGLGLGTKSIQPYIMSLALPLFPGFKSSSPTVRFYATEALYNLCKVTQQAVLVLFNEIFVVMVDLSNDTDDTVKNAADLLNQVMKDIIMISTTFNLDQFIPVLREKLYVHESVAQGTVVWWMTTVLKVPGANLVPHLPSLLDGIFILLSSANISVKKATESALGELLYHVEKNPQDICYKEMMSTLTIHAQSSDSKVKAVSLLWSTKFIRLSGRKMVPFISGILAAVIPCLAFDDEERYKCKSFADELNVLLIDLITAEDDMSTNIQDCDQPNDSEEDEIIDSVYKSNEINLAAIIDVLIAQLLNTPVACKSTALRWIYQLNIKLPLRMHRFTKKLFDLLMNTVCDQSDAVVLLGLQVIAQISSMDTSFDDKTSNYHTVKLLADGEYYTKFISSLFKMFYLDRDLLKERGHYIIRELCILLPAENIYQSFSILIQKDCNHNTDFVFEMVKSLSLILLTSKELFFLRRKMRHLERKENYELFVILYKTWCYCPVSALTLCLLAEKYDQAEIIIKSIAEIDITPELLNELDRLVQLIESPVFTFLRLRLVSQEEYPALVKTLYGILMLLPQTDVFQKLRIRMNCTPPYPLPSIEDESIQKYTVKNMELIDHFNYVQKSIEDSELMQTRAKLSTSMKISM